MDLYLLISKLINDTSIIDDKGNTIIHKIFDSIDKLDNVNSTINLLLNNQIQNNDGNTILHILFKNIDNIYLYNSTLYRILDNFDLCNRNRTICYSDINTDTLVLPWIKKGQ